jgi:hypothetical protein
MFRRNFRRALLEATESLLVCMELLWNRDDYVELTELSDRCDCSAYHVMANFSRRLQTHQNHDAVRELYLDVRWGNTVAMNQVESYRLRPELRDIVDDVLSIRDIR